MSRDALPVRVEACARFVYLVRYLKISHRVTAQVTPRRAPCTGPFYLRKVCGTLTMKVFWRWHLAKDLTSFAVGGGVECVTTLLNLTTTCRMGT